MRQVLRGGFKAAQHLGRYNKTRLFMPRMMSKRVPVEFPVSVTDLDEYHRGALVERMGDEDRLGRFTRRPAKMGVDSFSLVLQIIRAELLRYAPFLGRHGADKVVVMAWRSLPTATLNLAVRFQKLPWLKEDLQTMLNQSLARRDNPICHNKNPSLARQIDAALQAGESLKFDIRESGDGGCYIVIDSDLADKSVRPKF